MADTFADRIVAEIEAYFAPLIETDGNPILILNLLADIGWPLDRIAGVDQGKVVTAISSVVEHVGDLSDLAADPPDETEALLLGVAENLAPILVDVAALKDSLPTGLPADIADLPVDVLDFLTTRYLGTRLPPAYEVLRLLGVVVDPDPAPASSGGQQYRVRNAFPRLKPKQLVDLVTHPAETFVATYWPNGADNGEGAAAIGLKLWDLIVALGFAPDLAAALADAGGAVEADLDSGPPKMAISFSGVLDDGSIATAGAKLEVGTSAQGAPAVTLQPFGTASFTAAAGGWRATLAGDLEANPIEISGSGIRQLDAVKPPFSASLRVARGTSDEPAFEFGGDSGLKVTIGEVAASFGVTLSAAGPEIDLGFDLTPLRFGFGIGGGDGFMKSVLPGEGMGGEAELGLAWSNTKGVRFKGSASLTIDLADQIELGPITIVGLTITGKPHDAQFDVELAATIKAEIGPAKGVIERIGVRLAFAFPAGGGNLGPLDLTVGFKPPNGVGLSIDASVVKGAGYLYIDTDRGEYAGALELTFAVLSLKAIALLTTKRPDGSEGWSLLLMIYAQFPSPIQLSYGFTLSGVGGLIGLHHGCDRPQLESGMRTGAFDGILFPRDPVGNAPMIISQLRTIFPIRADALILGPMIEIGWGSPNIVKIRVGLLIQLDHVFGGGPLSVKQILILGQLEAALPPQVAPDETLLRLLIDFLGYIDLEEKVIGFVARLRDSRVSIVTLTGMFVLRISYGDRPTFVLAAGGFHPRFTDLPPGLPSPIDRVGGGFSIGPIDIQIAGYFAITPATVQTGASVTAHAEFGSIEIRGGFNFDTIFYFEPNFHFAVDVGCGFAVRWKGHTLAGVDFKGSLTGPGRWHLIGHAEFTVLLWTVSVDIDEAWGDPPELPPVAGIDVLALLAQDVLLPGSWSAQMPAGGDALVTISAAAQPNQTLAHPMSRLSFTQRRVPLKLAMERFGRTPIIGDKTIDITKVYVGSEGFEPSYSSEFFARANFVELPNEQKLAAPSFELLPAGVDVGTDAYSVGPDLGATLEYETAYLDPEQPAAPPVRDGTRHHLDFDHLVRQSAHGETARSQLRTADRLKPAASMRFEVTEAPVATVVPGSMQLSGNVEPAARYSSTLASQQAGDKLIVVELFEGAA